MSKELVKKGQLVKDIFKGEVAVPMSSRLRAPEATQEIDDIFGWKNANGAYIPFSDVYGAVKAQLHRDVQDLHIKRKHITQAMIKLGYLVKGKVKGGVIEAFQELDDEYCIKKGMLLPPNKYGQALVHGDHGVNGIYRKYKNNWGFNGLEYGKLTKLSKELTAYLTELNKAVEEVIVLTEKEFEGKGLRRATINKEVAEAVKEVYAEFLCKPLPKRRTK